MYRNLFRHFLMCAYLTQSSTDATDPNQGHLEDFSKSVMHSIGRLHVGEFNCTATIVAPDVILTNAHCFIAEDGQARSTAILFEGGATWENQTKVYVVDPDTVFVKTKRIFDEPWNDYCFMRLKRKVDVKKMPVAKISALLSTVPPNDASTHLSITGYDYVKGTTWYGRAVTSEAFLTDYYVEHSEVSLDSVHYGGMSGSPVYLFRNGAIVIVALYTGGVHSASLDSLSGRWSSTGHFKGYAIAAEGFMADLQTFITRK